MLKKRKWLIVSCISLIIIIFVGVFFFPQQNSRKSINITIDKGSNFSDEELNKAVDTTISDFNHSWKGSSLHSITFDNDLYQQEMASKVPGTSLFSDIPDENTLILLISFTTGKKTEGSIGPNFPVDYWRVILTRDSKNKPWRVIDQGV